MAYTINLTDGTIFAVVADGTINTDSSQTLVGKNYAGYGEFLDENFIRLLENAANTSAPGAPLTGQLWYDKTNNVIKVYNGTLFKSISGAISSASQPTSNVAGDLWFDSTNGQLKVYSGTSFITVGPASTSGQGTSGAVVATIADTLATDHVIVQMYVNNVIVSIFSKDATFTPAAAISGFATIGPGLNMSTTVSNAVFNGTASNADTLDSLNSTSFMRSDAATSNDTSISVLSDTGLYIGGDSDGHISVSGTDVRIDNDTQDGDLIFRVNDGGVVTTALTIDGATSVVNINTSAVATGNVTGGNIITAGQVTATGNITGGNLITSGTLSSPSLTATGNVTGGNIITAGQVAGGNFAATNGITAGTTIIATGNVTGGNLTTAGQVTATGNITSGNLTTAGQVAGGNFAATASITAGTTITATGNVAGGNITTAGAVEAGGNITAQNISVGVGNVAVGSITNNNADGVGNIGSAGVSFNTVHALATSAQYADMAERFHADAEYAPGTVVELGGVNEVTICTEELSTSVFGVVSDKPAYLMNGGAGTDATHPPIAMSGRVPVNVMGFVTKGDRLVSAGNGLARAATLEESSAFNVIGRALENKTDTEIGSIEAIVKIV